jgi:hypothetical protein
MTIRQREMHMTRPEGVTGPAKAMLVELIKLAASDARPYLAAPALGLRQEY